MSYQPQPQVKRGIDWSPLWKQEDWWSVWFGFILIILAIAGVITKLPSFGKWTSLGQAVPPEAWIRLIALLIGLGILNAIGVAAMGQSAARFLVAFPVVFILAIIAQILGNHLIAKDYNLEVPLWALVVGLLISNTVRTPEWLKPAVRTEMYIKTGLVLLGCEILFGRIVALGLPGIMVGWIVPPLVIIFMYWFGVKVLKMEPEFALTLGTATSVCGVSAAIATGAACGAKKEEVSVAITISLLFTVLMLVLMPAFIMVAKMDIDVGAAWIGGTIDSTGAVVAAGALLGQRGMEIASVVKMIQNVLIGVVAFVTALIWVYRKGGATEGVEAASAKEIWVRFPKFVLGFVAASLLFSFILIPSMGEEAVNGFTKITSGLRGWFFALAFISIGLESNIRDLARQVKGGKPVVHYIVGQTANLVLTLIMAWLAFGGILFPKTF
ncbi:MAG: putative sulfate exporter family transporter [Thermoanaerobacteraceae bacterium]|nr:putative sulfate exporter family transporter [Thermoanaerobacteraceae bacterium]